MNHLLRLTLLLAAALLLAAPASAQILGTPALGDGFSNAVATGDFDSDGHDDLAISARGEDLGAIENAGVVHVIYGTPGGGLADTGNQVWSQDSPGILDAAEVDDRFGDTLAAGDFDGDGFDDLAIGVPDEDIGTIINAGQVHVLYGTSVGLSAARNQIWYQGLAAAVAVRLPSASFSIARGQTFTFVVTFTTGPNAPSSFEYWTEATLPNGTVRGPFFGPNIVLMDPEQSITLGFSQRVPSGAPLGDYTYAMQAGTFLNTVMAEDSFPITVTAAARIAAGETDLADDAWRGYDGAGTLLEAGTVTDLRGLTQGELDMWAAGEEAPPAAAGAAHLPEALALHPAAPNPFNPSTTLRFDVPETGHVRLAVYDALGCEVAVLLDGAAEAGTHTVAFVAGRLPSGVYLVRLEAGAMVRTQRLTLLR